MDDLISRQAAIEVIEKMMEVYWDRKVVLARAWDQIKDLPTAERRGKWIVKEKVYPDLPNDSDYRYECSLCGWEDRHNEKMIVPYCWHCGARMDGE